MRYDDLTAKSMNDDTIESISIAVEKIKLLKHDKFAEDNWSFHKFPFWLWFRGQSVAGRLLTPHVFRKIEVEEADEILKVAPLSNPARGNIWDESNLFEHLRLRVPHYRQTHTTALDWLCLMQHYSLPTRLLDWSESILPALYFAVRDDLDKPGELVVLNARLNAKSKSRPTLSTANDPNVIIRAEMASFRDTNRLKRHPDVIAASRKSNINLEDTNWFEPFRKPLAFLPYRSNDRMVFQASVFTIHGGKLYPEEMKKHYENELIPEPISLEALDDKDTEDKCILKRYLIPAQFKEGILADLLLLGIHEGTLFPEIDHQAAYLKTMWRV
jgi:hypothetical protein